MFHGVTQDPYRALAYCLGWSKSSRITTCMVQECSIPSDTASAAYYLDLLESCINLLAKRLLTPRKTVREAPDPVERILGRYPYTYLPVKIIIDRRGVGCQERVLGHV